MRKRIELTRRAALLLSLVSLSFAAVPLQDAPTGDPVTIAFRVPEGTELSKSVRMEHALIMDRMSMKVGDDDAVKMDVRSIIQSKLELDFSDRYLAFDGGRITGLRRAYDAARLRGQLQIQQLADLPPKVAEMVSPLQGKSVVFTYVPEENGYGRYYDALEGEEEHLPALGVATDLASLLPGKPVRVGETWAVDGQELLDVVAPAGMLHFKAGKTFDRLLGRALTAGVGGGLEQAFGGESDGGVKLKLEGFEELDGARVARISLVVQAKFGKDQTDFSRENIVRREEERGAEFVSNHLVLRLSGDGVLLWDVAAGYARQLTFDLAEEISMRVVEKHQDSGVRFEQDMGMQGRFKARFDIAPKQQ